MIMRFFTSVLTTNFSSQPPLHRPRRSCVSCLAVLLCSLAPRVHASCRFSSLRAPHPRDRPEPVLNDARMPPGPARALSLPMNKRPPSAAVQMLGMPVAYRFPGSCRARLLLLRQIVSAASWSGRARARRNRRRRRSWFSALSAPCLSQSSTRRQTSGGERASAFRDFPLTAVPATSRREELTRRSSTQPALAERCLPSEWAATRSSRRWAQNSRRTNSKR